MSAARSSIVVALFALTACGQDTQPPTAPQGLAAEAVNSARVDLSWTPSTDAGSGVVGYRVYRNSEPSPLGSVAALRYQDVSVAAGARYFYQVRAYDAAGNESEAAVRTVTTPSSATPPAAPSGIVAIPDDRTATIGWTAPNDGGSPITRYTVMSRPGGVSTTTAGRITSALVTGLTNGRTYTFSVIATNAVGNGPPSASSAAVTPATRPASTFPLTYSSNRRYLQDQRGAPFPILGRTAWFVLALAPSDYQLFINDSVARGYNAIEMHVLNHDPRGKHPPRNGLGDLPFLKRLDGADWSGALSYSTIGTDAPDFTTPNPAYWHFVDAFLSHCESSGILVFLFPAYVGYAGREQGWMQEMVANGPAKVRAYGAWLASRYAHQRNIVWMMGGDLGDFSPSQTAVESALLEGLKSVPGQQSIQFSAEWASESIATDQPAFGSSMTLNGVYSWTGKVSVLGRRAYAYHSTLPAFLLEEPYDEEGPDGNGVNPHATQPVRRFQWWGLLSTTAGHISGNGYVWPFSDPRWKDHLDTQGSRDTSHLNAFVESVSWWELVPSRLSGMKRLVVAGGAQPTGDNYVAAAATPSGTLLVAYVPPAHTGGITIDMTAMSGPASARWFSPATGASIAIGTFENIGRRVFVPPGDNGSGFADWVLAIEKR
jgi:hypothetical protein